MSVRHGLRMAAGLGCLVAAASAAVPPGAASANGNIRAVRPLNAHGPLGTERLSDERRLSRYAGAVARASVRARPHRGAPRVGRLRLLTEDGPYEVYPVLESYLDASGRTWLHVRLPGRPNGRTGWVSRHGLGPLHSVRTALGIDRRTLRATLRRDGRKIWSSRIGVGKASTPTPAGHFWIRTRLRGLSSNPVYGPYAFGTGAYSSLSDWPGGGVIGIHGTNQPHLLPGRVSHGCIRVPNTAIKGLWRRMPIGTPVSIT